MKKISFALILSIYTFFALGQSPSISNAEAVNIFENLTNLKPIKCVVGIVGDKPSIICLADKRGAQNEVFSNPDIYYYKLTLFANTWQIDRQQSVFKEDYKYCQFLNDPEIVTIAEEPYIYFVYSLAEMGNSAGDEETLKFSLFSLNKYQLTTLDYDGDASFDKNGSFQNIKNGTFLNLEKLKSYPTIFNFLEEKASKSRFVYRPTQKDLDINDPINFEKKWTLDNPDVVEKVYLAGKPNLYNESLHITYYNETLFPTDKSHISEKTENLKYEFITSFRGSVLGFDKNKRKYFPIWVDGCNAGCDKDISLPDPNTLKIVYHESNDQTILVNLSKMTYSLSYKRVVDQSLSTETSYSALKTDYFKTLGQPIFLYKPASLIKGVLVKDKAWHFDGYMQSDLSQNILTFSRNYQPPNSYAFQASYHYWIIGDQSICMHVFVEFPAIYFKYMLSKFKGFVIIDGTHLQSSDREVGVNVSVNNGICDMEFYRNN